MFRIPFAMCERKRLRKKSKMAVFFNLIFLILLRKQLGCTLRNWAGEPDAQQVIVDHTTDDFGFRFCSFSL